MVYGKPYIPYIRILWDIAHPQFFMGQNPWIAAMFQAPGKVPACPLTPRWRHPKLWSRAAGSPRFPPPRWEVGGVRFVTGSPLELSPMFNRMFNRIFHYSHDGSGSVLVDWCYNMTGGFVDGKRQTMIMAYGSGSVMGYKSSSDWVFFRHWGKPKKFRISCRGSPRDVGAEISILGNDHMETS